MRGIVQLTGALKRRTVILRAAAPITAAQPWFRLTLVDIRLLLTAIISCAIEA